MLEATTRRDGKADRIGSRSQDKQRRRLLVAIVLLLSAVILILAKDRDFWFAAEETSAAEDVQPVSSASTLPAQAPAIAAKPANPVTAKRSAQPAAKTTSHRAVLPQLHTDVASGAAHTASNAAETVQMASAKIPVADSVYPLLAGKMSVQGSVLMQALIAADGVVEDLRVLSGPTILVPAAREAVRQWKFKPYLENGRPVETQARVTVNFTIKVSNNTARYQPTSITSDGAL